jgi:predicted outer membrane protein
MQILHCIFFKGMPIALPRSSLARSPLMRHIHYPLALALPACAALLVAFAVAGPLPAQAQADPLAERARAEQEHLPPVELGAADRDFIGFALERSRALGNALQIAQDRTLSPELQVLAESMHEEQLATTRALLELAGRDSEPAATTMVQFRELAELQTTPQEQFDRRFAALLRSLHDEVLQRFRAAEHDPQLHPQVRELASQALPLFELHLELVAEVAPPG